MVNDSFFSHSEFGVAREAFRVHFTHTTSDENVLGTRYCVIQNDTRRNAVENNNLIQQYEESYLLQI
jgi:hypothetical protein